MSDLDLDARATEWGKVAVAISENMKVWIADLDVSIGKDEDARHHAYPAVSFLHGGALRIPRANFGGQGPWDRLVILKVTCRGRTQVHVEQIWQEVLLSLDEVQHGNEGTPGTESAQEGAQTNGNGFFEYTGSILVRVNVARPDPEHVTPEAFAISLYVKHHKTDTPELAPIEQPAGGP